MVLGKVSGIGYFLSGQNLVLYTFNILRLNRYYEKNNEI